MEASFKNAYTTAMQRDRGMVETLPNALDQIFFLGQVKCAALDKKVVEPVFSCFQTIFLGDSVRMRQLRQKPRGKEGRLKTLFISPSEKHTGGAS